MDIRIYTLKECLYGINISDQVISVVKHQENQRGLITKSEVNVLYDLLENYPSDVFGPWSLWLCYGSGLFLESNS